MTQQSPRGPGRYGLGARPVPALALAAGLSLGLALGCTPQPGTPAPAPGSGPTSPAASSPAGPATGPSGASSPGASSAGGSSAGPSVTYGSEPPVPSVTASQTASVRPPPPRPTAPAPSTAGGLTARDLPSTVLGFTAAARPPAEGEYVPNGTWVHAVEPRQAAWEAMPPCGSARDTDARPRAALAGTYRNPQGRPGNGLVLEFPDARAAAAYATAYRQGLRQCGTSGALATRELRATSGWYVGRRSYGPDRWSEIVATSANRVTLLIVNDDHRVPEQQLVAAASRLAAP